MRLMRVCAFMKIFLLITFHLKAGCSKKALSNILIPFKMVKKNQKKESLGDAVFMSDTIVGSIFCVSEIVESDLQHPPIQNLRNQNQALPYSQQNRNQLWQ